MDIYPSDLETTSYVQEADELMGGSPEFGGGSEELFIRIFSEVLIDEGVIPEEGIKDEAVFQSQLMNVIEDGPLEPGNGALKDGEYYVHIGAGYIIPYEQYLAVESLACKQVDEFFMKMALKGQCGSPLPSFGTVFGIGIPLVVGVIWMINTIKKRWFIDRSKVELLGIPRGGLEDEIASAGRSVKTGQGANPYRVDEASKRQQALEQENRKNRKRRAAEKSVTGGDDGIFDVVRRLGLRGAAELIRRLRDE